MNNYIELALRTESTQWNEPDHRILHAAMGLVTESAELLSSTDKGNFAEELGDILWYLAIACDAMGITFDETMECAADFRPSLIVGREDLVNASAEILDIIKKSVFYGKLSPPHKMVELLGEIILTVANFEDLDKVQAANIEKLEKRFPELKFTRERAIDRDVKNEISHL